MYVILYQFICQFSGIASAVFNVAKNTCLDQSGYTSSVWRMLHRNERTLEAIAGGDTVAKVTGFL